MNKAKLTAEQKLIIATMEELQDERAELEQALRTAREAMTGQSYGQASQRDIDDYEWAQTCLEAWDDSNKEGLEALEKKAKAFYKKYTPLHQYI